MEKRTDDTLNAIQEKTDCSVWKGRSVPEGLEPQYWYQLVQVLEIEAQMTNKAFEQSPNNFVLLGYVCDEGIRRNQGRVGAANGPLAIRKQLAKLALHFQDTQIWDAGNIICNNGGLEEAQALLSENVGNLLAASTFPIVLGGGHDMAYGHGKGILDNLKSEQRLGIINFDAHFDLRPVEDKPNSGTPFYQLLMEAKANDVSLDYMAIGIQAPANTPSLFDIAKSLTVDFIPIEHCQWHHLAAVSERLDTFLTQVDMVYLTIDLDGFSAAHAPGVSASAPIGLEPFFVMELLQLVIDSKKLCSLDIAELNPHFDLDDRTAKLAARLIEYLIRGLVATKP